MERLFDNQGTNIFGPPSIPGVYAVCIKANKGSKERILYIGGSKNCLKRMMSPNHPYRICFDRFKNMSVYTKTIITTNFEQIERELISEYRPLLNKNFK